MIKTFLSEGEAIQYLADSISDLSKRVSELESAKMAQAALLTWLIDILQSQDGTTRDVLIHLLDSWRSRPDEDPNLHERVISVQQVMSDIIIARGKFSVNLTVVPGGKRDE